MMTMKLYFNPKSRATIAKWMLDEVGASYETVLIDLEKKEHKQPSFMAINPAGKLPALVVVDEDEAANNTTRLFENAAIALWLGDKFPEKKLAPTIAQAERGRYLSLVVYATSQLEPAMGDSLLKLDTHPSRGWTNFEAVQDAVERELGDGPWLLGNWFTMADVLVASLFHWRARFGAQNRPKIAAYVARALERPAAAAIRG